MGNVTKPGSLLVAYKSTRGAIVDTGNTVANTWYEIASRGASSALPTGLVEGQVFKSPDASSLTQITLAAGDSVYPLTLTQMFKTDSEISMEEGTIEVTDDSSRGYNANILDGYKSISGSLGGFAKFDEATGRLITDVHEVIGRYFDKVTDDNQGTYTYEAAANEQLLLFYLLNKDAGVGSVQNWLIIPVLLSSLGGGAGLKEAQKRDVSWTKGEGPAAVYQRTVGAGDVL